MKAVEILAIKAVGILAIKAVEILAMKAVGTLAIKAGIREHIYSRYGAATDNLFEECSNPERIALIYRFVYGATVGGGGVCRVEI